ncbi:MAG: SUMF1/EgtB/PvdO family nonheme iron enzyme [Gammaproteobacteria bacterium]
MRNALFTDLARIGGDDRPGVGLNDQGLPDIDWVEIPAGPFLYGEDQEKIELDGFFISRYPITHAQFQAFIDQGGYDQNQLWWQGLQHEPPEKAAWPFANRPRECVSWYDATAFCRWLSVQTGQIITLPTEQQWEKAARGEKGREYPWGDKYQSGYANCNEKRGKKGPFYLSQTSAVGIYPPGRSPYGIEDMAGNVWEWTSSFYDADKDSYVFRGGAWSGNPDSLRASFRLRFLPDSRLSDFGFRVVCVPHR